LKAAIEDLKAGRLQAGWEKLEHYGVIKEITDGLVSNPERITSALLNGFEPEGNGCVS
jgi:hypothetical protein